MSYLMISDLNPDKHLSVAIAATFAVLVFHLHRDTVLRGCLVKVFDWKSYNYEELSSNVKKAFAVNNNSCRGSDFAASSVAFASASSAGSQTSSQGPTSSPIDAYTAAIYSSSASSSLNNHKNIQDKLTPLLPLILDYKINVSKQAFKASGKVFELLNEDDKEKFLFNLDILR